jgi:galactarate dehydratase
MSHRSCMLTLHPQDNIAVVLANISAGEIDNVTGLKVLRSVKQGHKIAIAAISAGQNVLRYGQTIGQATADIA